MSVAANHQRIRRQQPAQVRIAQVALHPGRQQTERGPLHLSLHPAHEVVGQRLDLSAVAIRSPSIRAYSRAVTVFSRPTVQPLDVFPVIFAAPRIVVAVG